MTEFHVTFEIRTEEDREATLKAGRFIGRHTDFAVITWLDSKDVRRRPVSEELLNEWRHGRWRGGAQIRPPALWAVHAYEEWKARQPEPPSGDLRKAADDYRRAAPPSQHGRDAEDAWSAFTRTPEFAAISDGSADKTAVPLILKPIFIRGYMAASAPAPDIRHVLTQCENLFGQLYEHALRQCDTSADPNSPNEKRWAEQRRIAHEGRKFALDTRAALAAPDPDDLSAEYERIFGRQPPARMRPETIRERIRKARLA
jgi:hypothetical protein